MIRGKIVLVPFPFDDFSGTKVRPAICLTNEIGFYNHIVIAFISSQVPDIFDQSDFILEKTDKDFATTGLTVRSVIKLHRLVTIPKNLIKRQLGTLPSKWQMAIDKNLKVLFNLK
ncbi:type II toxin-antitoxin system PemK/MazF family toxin [Adhaeribacter pallidiroseus]|uniref:Type II toxin-antitoxin system PemK/MazF family toxin n=1 Tax=Adhaeribacter pallidiroseus TaxID=2072847 RepID=A0A369QHA4_9BACT|nr:type II toxin-antitoxin system PemK/MazF family toxin [Adhaeribacter pallidiroseus]RDC64303.1 hypothetical protein AHMF7616_02916 [Adhaeribacter pallidiroseus]